MNFCSTFSSQIRSSSGDADFWLADRFRNDGRWYIRVGKYPKRSENLNRIPG